MRNNKVLPSIFLLSLVLLLSVSVASALLDETQTSSNSLTGLQVDYPKFEIVKINQPFNLSVTTYNISTGLEVTSATCSLAIQNHTGTEQTFSLPYFSGAYRVFIDAGNFSQIDTFSFNIYCNASTIGGFASGNFIVTPTGEQLSISQAILYVLFLIASLLILSFFMYWSIELPFKNQRDERGFYLFVNDKKWVKIVCIVGSYLVAMWVFALLHSTTANYLQLESVGAFFYYFYYIMLSALLPLLIATIIVMFVIWLRDLKIKKGIKQNLRMK